MHRYLSCWIPAGAVLLTALFGAALTPNELKELTVEGGVIENWTVLAYGLAILTLCLTLGVTTDKLTVAAILVALVGFAAREMDLHVTLTGTSVLRLSYYLKGAFTPDKAVALAVVAAVALSFAYLCLRHGRALLHGLRAREPAAIATVVFVVTVLVAKSLDRSVSIMTEDFGLDIPATVATLIVSFEEVLELVLPLLVATAAAQYFNARRKAAA